MHFPPSYLKLTSCTNSSGRAAMRSQRLHVSQRERSSLLPSQVSSPLCYLCSVRLQFMLPPPIRHHHCRRRLLRYRRCCNRFLRDPPSQAQSFSGSLRAISLSAVSATVCPYLRHLCHFFHLAWSSSRGGFMPG